MRMFMHSLFSSPSSPSGDVLVPKINPVDIWLVGSTQLKSGRQRVQSSQGCKLNIKVSKKTPPQTPTPAFLGGSEPSALVATQGVQCPGRWASHRGHPALAW